MIDAMPRHRLLTGQQDLFGAAPPVAYCRVCGRRLRSAASLRVGIGPLCSRRCGQTPLVVCAECGKPVLSSLTGQRRSEWLRKQLAAQHHAGELATA